MHCAPISASMGGRGGGRFQTPKFNSDDSGLILGPGSSQQRQPQKLFIPGQQRSAPGAPAKIVVPDQGTERILSDGAAALGPEVTTPTQPNRYRPPQGFMNESIKEDASIAKMTPDDMLNRLRARAGAWYTLAKFITPLYQQSFDSTIIDEATGITPAQQNKWVVAGTIYDSLVDSGKVSAKTLEYFEDQKGCDLLYPFRFLNNDARVQCAQFVMDNKLEEPVSNM